MMYSPASCSIYIKHLPEQVGLALKQRSAQKACSAAQHDVTV